MKIKNSIYVVLFFTLIFSGCEKIKVGEAFDVKIGELYRIDWDLSFTIDSINDYRCAKDVVCVWAEDVNLYFNINHAFNHTDTVIYLNTHNNNPFVIADYTWEVLEVNPYPVSTKITEPSDITIKMILLKN